MEKRGILLVLSVFIVMMSVGVVSAASVMQRDAQVTIRDGATLPGGDGDCDNSPDDVDCWKWVVKNLDSAGTTSITNNANLFSYSGPVIGITNDFALTNTRNGALEAGECASLPENYVSICFDSLTVSDNDYMPFSFRLYESFDSRFSNPNEYNIPVGAQAISIQSAFRSDTLSIDLDAKGFRKNEASSRDPSSDQVWIYPWDSTEFAVYMSNDLGGNVEPTLVGWVSGDTPSSFAYIDYGSIAGPIGITSITIQTVKLSDGSLQLGVRSNAVDTVYSRWKWSGTRLSLGNIANKEEADELSWITTNIGAKDEDHLTGFGIRVLNPKENGDRDIVSLEIPSDEVKGNIIVKQPNSNAVTESIRTGINIGFRSRGYFNNPLTKRDLSGMAQEEITYSGPDYRATYDLSDELYFSSLNSITLETSLTSGDDNYEDNVYLEIPRKSLLYVLSFDEALRDPLDPAEPLDLPFLGTTLTITDVLSGTSAVAEVTGGTPTPPTPPTPTTDNKCPDVNFDGIVNQADLDLISSQFGRTSSRALGEYDTYDINNDGVINIKDQSIVAKNNGKIASKVDGCRDEPVDGSHTFRHTTLREGQSVKFNDQTVTLDRIGSSAVIVGVDGRREQIDLFNHKHIGGIVVYIPTLVYESNSPSESYAEVVIVDPEIYPGDRTFHSIRPDWPLYLSSGDRYVGLVSSGGDSSALVVVSDIHPAKGAGGGSAGQLRQVGTGTTSGGSGGGGSTAGSSGGDGNFLSRIARTLGFFILGE